MNVNLIAYLNVTKDKKSFDLEEAELFSAKMAGVCYMESSFNDLINEDIQNTRKRLNGVLKSGHHSVFDHYKLTFELSSIPKIIAMILNNENDYATSEKSARYTHFSNLPKIQSELYCKWFDKLKVIIKDTYPKLYDETKKEPYKQIEKLAQENARYFISIFTPLTTMIYTTSLRQLNYILYMCKDYIKYHEKNNFNENLVPLLEELVEYFKEYIIPELIPKGKNRHLSLFGNPKYKDLEEIFSYVYQTNYEASFSCLAQIQRHRSENVFIYMLDEFKFYTPEILTDKNLIEEWMRDAKSVKDNFPQGMLVKIIQTGNIDTLLLKARERVCGKTQLETMRHTVDILQRYATNSKYSDSITDITNNKKAKCSFSNGVCDSPCFMKSDQFNRHI
ncbi:MAG: FAD-dependent thymidylate synthase [Clostridia bacterium]